MVSVSRSGKWDYNLKFLTGLLWEKNMLTYWVTGSLSLNRHLVNVDLHQSTFIKTGHLVSWWEKLQNRRKILQSIHCGCLTHLLGLTHPHDSHERARVESSNDVLTLNVFNSPLFKLPSEYVFLLTFCDWCNLVSILFT